MSTNLTPAVPFRRRGKGYGRAVHRRGPRAGWGTLPGDKHPGRLRRGSAKRSHYLKSRSANNTVTKMDQSPCGCPHVRGMNCAMPLKSVSA